MPDWIDLRSDTVTTPTERMRLAMYHALVGDDVLGEDPTVKRLEARAAALFEKEAGLFVVSGTMANQVSVLTLCNCGDQIIVHRQSHMYNLEVAGLTTTCHVQPRAVDVPDGHWDIREIEKEIHQTAIQTAPTTLLCLEETHDLNRGLAIPAEHIHAVCRFARSRGLKVFIDGARIFNASSALGAAVEDLAADADLVSFCLSKGLACPVGAMLVGDQDTIARARRMRQRLGGGWRQAGVLAAAGLVALDEMVERLSEDHRNALSLAEGLLELGFGIDLDQVQTNIIHVDLEPLGIDAKSFCRKLAGEFVKVKPIGEHEVRMITHKDVHFSDVKLVLNALARMLEKTLVLSE